MDQAIRDRGFTEKAKAEGKAITVTLKEFGGQDEQLTQQLALDFSSGAGADVSSFDGFLIPSFVEGGLLKPVAEIAGDAVEKWEGWSHISQGARDLMSFKGQDYGIALETDVRAIFVRKDLLQAAGIDPATFQPKSWAELLDAARAIKKANPESFPLQLNAGVNMGEATTMQGYYMVLLGTGESVVDDSGKYIVSSQGILDTLNLYKTVYVDEQLGDQRAQLLADGRNRTFSNFRDGKTAMLVEGDWFFNSVMAPGGEFGMDDRDAKVGWTSMPAIEPGKGFRGQDFVPSRGYGFRHQPEHQQPGQVLGVAGLHEQRRATQQIPKPPQGAPHPRHVPTPNNLYLEETSKTLLPLTTARPNDPNYNKVSAEIQRMTESVVSGELSPQDAMAQYKAAVTAIVGAANTVSKL